MARSKSILAFDDCKKAFDQAIMSDNGVILTFSDATSAATFKYRCMSFRMLDRDQNKVLYPDPAATMHGHSIYDTIAVCHPKGGSRLEFRKIKPDYTVEEIMEPGRSNNIAQNNN